MFAWGIGRQDIQGYSLLRDRLFLSPFSSFLSTGIIDRVKGLGFNSLVNHVSGRVAFLWSFVLLLYHWAWNSKSSKNKIIFHSGCLTLRGRGSFQLRGSEPSWKRWMKTSPRTSWTTSSSRWVWSFTIIITRPKPTGGSLCASGAQLGSRKWLFFVTHKHTFHHNIYIITIINLTIITEDELGDIMRWVETVMWRPIRRRKYLEDREMIQASFRLTQMAPERSISMSLSRSWHENAHLVMFGSVFKVFNKMWIENALSILSNFHPF